MAGVFNPTTLGGRALTTGISLLDASTFGGLREGGVLDLRRPAFSGKDECCTPVCGCECTCQRLRLSFSQIEMSEEQWIGKPCNTDARVAAIDMRNPRFLGDAEIKSP